MTGKPTEMSRPTRLYALALVVALAGALPACAVHPTCGSGGCPGDAAITAGVLDLFHRYPALEPPNLIHVETVDHVVYLTGQVDTGVERSLAESVAREVAGVKRIVNSINLSYRGGP